MRSVRLRFLTDLRTRTSVSFSNEKREVADSIRNSAE